MKQKTEKIKVRKDHRQLRHGSYSIALSAIVVAGAVVLNLIAGEIPSQYTKFDLSGQQLTVLTSQTKEVLAGLTEDVTLYYIVQDSNIDTTVSRLLERYGDQSSHVTVVQKDPVLYPQFTSQYTDESVTENSVIVVCGDQSRVVSYSDMYETEFSYSYYSYQTTGFDAEGQLTSAISALSSSDLPKLYTLTGHNESELSSSLTESIEKQNIETDSLNLVTSDAVPDDASCLLIISPRSDLSEAEAQKILNYLRRGGSAIIVTDYTGTEMPNLDSVMEYYGTQRVEGVVLEGNSNYYVQMPYYLVPTIDSTEISSDLAGGNSYVLVATAQGLQTTDDVRDGVDITSVLTTSDSAYSKTDIQNMTTYAKEDGDIDGPFDLAVLITETVELTDELLEETASVSTDSSLTSALDGLEVVEDETDEGAEDAAEAESAAAEEGSGAESAAAEDGAEDSSENDAAAEEGTEAASAAEDSGEAESAEAAEDSTEAAEEDSSEAADVTEAETDEEAATEASASSDAAEPETAETKLAIFTSSALLDSSMNQMVSGGNYELFVNALSWACGQETSVSVPVKSLTVNYLTLTSASCNFWSIVTIAVIPGVLLIGGLAIWLGRRKR